jgi:predicted 3-demethylubiquinone-9 3-methyltransferase (glyoxalase superfamily)
MKGHLMRRITPCLWFDGKAEEAMNFYTSIFKHAKVGDVMRWGDTGPGKKDSVLSVTFELDGQEFIGLNGGPTFQFSPAVSFFVRCENQDEVDYYWDRLLEGGKPRQCGWLTDKFGVSWQVVPKILGDMLKDKDAAKANRVMAAMMKQIKLDVGLLKAAYESGGP